MPIPGGRVFVDGRCQVSGQRKLAPCVKEWAHEISLTKPISPFFGAFFFPSCLWFTRVALVVQ